MNGVSARAEPAYAVRHAAIDLGALDDSVPTARLHARMVLIGWGHSDLASEGGLVVSELVTNGVRFGRLAPTVTGAPPPVRVRITERNRGVPIEVWDGHEAMPEPRNGGADPEAEGGRGLALVAAYAARWGAYRARGGGKVTWAEITRLRPGRWLGAPQPLWRVGSEAPARSWGRPRRGPPPRAGSQRHETASKTAGRVLGGFTD